MPEIETLYLVDLFSRSKSYIDKLVAVGGWAWEVGGRIWFGWIHNNLTHRVAAKVSHYPTTDISLNRLKSH